MSKAKDSRATNVLALACTVLALSLAGCGQSGDTAADSNSANALSAAEGEPIVLNESEGEALAGEAAAAEAADTSVYGGNAAAGEAEPATPANGT